MSRYAEHSHKSEKRKYNIESLGHLCSDIRVLHMDLASSKDHHKQHNIKPRFNNYSI